MIPSCSATRASAHTQCLERTMKKLPSSQLRSRQLLKHHFESPGLRNGARCFAKPATAAARRASPTSVKSKRQSLDRETIMSVLAVSATKRDAKGYLQKYAPQDLTSLKEAPKFVQGKQNERELPALGDARHAAIVKLCTPQVVDEGTLLGLAKTLSQLRVLGLLSVVIVDCGPGEPRRVYQEQTLRLCEAIDSFGRSGSRPADHTFIRQSGRNSSAYSYLASDIEVDSHRILRRALRHGLIPVVPALCSQDVTTAPQPADSNRLILALTKYLIGMQFEGTRAGITENEHRLEKPESIASVERVIVLDPVGGTPVVTRPGASMRFVNLEQEYPILLKKLEAAEDHASRSSSSALTAHAANLKLTKDVLSILPPSASALITTPFAASNTMQAEQGSVMSPIRDSTFGFEGMVTTRKKQNPLLHNLLTDRPVYSPSLPVPRIKDGAEAGYSANLSTAATILKRGMPLTIYPDTRQHPWTPPQPGAPRLRLTDTCIDLPRLVYLIEDSFHRKLDVDDYLKRVNENLAGVIIAGEYEGGAILTWERPEGLDSDTAFASGRLVPYLDKFAVLRSRQGSGGVADILFNAMVQDCFPNGVCWRSRKNNPVNKWYFERSAGAAKLSDSNWSMFWTTPGLIGSDAKLEDYESVCRGVEASWADNKDILE